MKKGFNFACLASIFGLTLLNTVYAQVDVQSDGAVKIGDLSKTDHLSGSSLEVAVNKLFIYPTNNLNGAFTIYNNTQTPTPGGGGIIVTPSSLNEPSNNRSTYVEPYAAGKLVLGTSSKPLGWVSTQGITSNSQRTTSDRRVKKDILDLPSSLAAIRALRPVSFNYDTEKLPMNPALANGHAGFIAQEVLDVLPLLVSYDSAVDLYSMDYISLIPYLTKALQEQDSLLQQQQELLHSYAEALADLAERVSDMESLTGGSPQQPSKAPKAPAGNDKDGISFPCRLFQNVPNPATGETRIRYELPDGTTDARIGIYQPDGREVSLYNLSDHRGELVLKAGELKPGMYLYSLIVNGQVQDTKRMVVTR